MLRDYTSGSAARTGLLLCDADPATNSRTEISRRLGTYRECLFVFQLTCIELATGPKRAHANGRVRWARRRAASAFQRHVETKRMT